MTNYQTQPANVEAEQWTGDDASLTAIQRLIFPASPLRPRKNVGAWPNQVSSRLGVFVDDASMTGYSLEHIDINDWVVKFQSGAIKVVKAKEFEELFRPAVRTPNEIARMMGLPDSAKVERPSLKDA